MLFCPSGQIPALAGASRAGSRGTTQAGGKNEFFLIRTFEKVCHLSPGPFFQAQLIDAFGVCLVTTEKTSRHQLCSVRCTERLFPVTTCAKPLIQVVTENTARLKACLFAKSALLQVFCFSSAGLSQDIPAGFPGGFRIASFRRIQLEPRWCTTPPKSRQLCFCLGATF